MKDPNKQQHHTFGTSPAALRLKVEIDKPGSKYRAAVSKLSKGLERANDIYGSHIRNKRYFLALLRKDVTQHIDSCGSDDIIKSLCKNVFVTGLRIKAAWPGEIATQARINKLLNNEKV